MVKHELVPKHELLSLEEAKLILETYNVTLDQMPKILKDDPAIRDFKANPGDLIKIVRTNELGKSIYYRGVVE